MTIKIRRIDGTFVASCSYEERLILKRQGFKFASVGGMSRWITNDPDIAMKFYDNCVDEAKEYFDNLEIIKKELVEASFAEDYDGDLLCPSGQAYLAFQKAGIAYALARRDTLIGDDMGLGKTPQALGIINNTPKARKILIVVPASLKINWEREANKWLMHDLRIEIVRSKPKTVFLEDGTKKSVTEYLWPDTDVYIINYDMLEQYYDRVREFEWDILICDEAHVLKNTKSNKCKQVFGYSGKKKSEKRTPISAKKRVFLTGTPILNKPIDLYVLASQCAPEVFGHYPKFVKRYCDAYETNWGLDVTGASNLEEFQEKLRSTFMIRRMKKDVLKELPEKRRQVVVLPSDGLSRIVKKEKQVFADNLKSLAILNGEAVEEDFEDVSDLQITKIIEGIANKITDLDNVDLEEYMKIHFEAIAYAREEIGLSKVKMVAEYAKMLLESTNKVVIFAVHKAVVQEIKKHFPDTAVVVGGMSPEAKQAEVDRFRNDPDCTTITLNLAAGSVGYTLVEANHLIMAELGFVPPILEQAEDRIYRIGQKNAANIHYLVVDQSVEAKLMDIFVEKLAIIDKALNRQP
jgi:SNF2 family DNA or RNA helicase